MTPQQIVNISAHLPRMADLQPDTPAIIFPQGDLQLTFRDLDDLSDRIAHGLVAIGIGRGVRTVLMVPPGPEFFALTFALFKVAAVPVLIDPGLGVKNLKACLAEAEPRAFIGITKAHLARLMFGWGKDSIHTLVTVGRRLLWRGETLSGIIARSEEQQPFSPARTVKADTAAILFTSGSTGPPKGAVYTHGNFAAQVEALRTVYGIQPGEIDLPTFPLFALFAPALGMTAVIPEMDFTRPGSVNPNDIISAIREYGVTTMFGSPALINRVGRYGAEREITLPTLRRVISAGAPVPAAVMERFSSMLDPQAEIFTPYGATEALPVCSIGSSEILGETCHLTAQGRGVCVGLPVEGIELAIIPISDTPLDEWSEELALPPWDVGEIAVKGEQVTASYINRSEATRLAKIPDPLGGFWHRMGDLGYQDREGRVWFCGRKAHRVITPQETLYTIPVEGVFNSHPQVSRTALVGVGEPGKQQPVLCVELEADIPSDETGRIRRELIALGSKYPHTKCVLKILFHPSFPVDIRHNAKIFREQLAAWAAEQPA
ncbi:MAG: AMP-binding protein [Desulfuromonadales bacterium]|nr:AMP-binding protein [Desulfuromonadales bacterium]